MKINEVNTDTKDENEEPLTMDKKESSKKDTLSDKDSAAEEGDEKKKDLTFPSTLTPKEKLAIFRTFGRKNEKDEGKILKDENDEDVELDANTYKRAMSYYGHWTKFAFLAAIIGCVKWLEI